MYIFYSFIFEEQEMQMFKQKILTANAKQKPKIGIMSCT